LSQINFHRVISAAQPRAHRPHPDCYAQNNGEFLQF